MIRHHLLFLLCDRLWNLQRYIILFGTNPRCLFTIDLGARSSPICLNCSNQRGMMDSLKISHYFIIAKFIIDIIDLGDTGIKAACSDSEDNP